MDRKTCDLLWISTEWPRGQDVCAWECLMILQSAVAPAFLVSLFLFFNYLLLLNNYLINSFKVIFIFKFIFQCATSPWLCSSLRSLQQVGLLTRCRSPASRCANVSCCSRLGLRAQWLWRMGLAALWRLELSQTRGPTQSPALVGSFLTPELQEKPPGSLSLHGQLWGSRQPGWGPPRSRELGKPLGVEGGLANSLHRPPANTQREQGALGPTAARNWILSTTGEAWAWILLQPSLSWDWNRADTCLRLCETWKHKSLSSHSQFLVLLQTSGAVQWVLQREEQMLAIRVGSPGRACFGSSVC